MRRKRNSLLVAITFVVLSSLSPSFAAELVWNTATSDWFTPGNWTPMGPPTGADQADINNGGTAQIAAAGATANIIELGFGVGESGTISITGAGTLNIPNVVDMGFSGDGTINVTTGGKVTARTTRIATDTASTGLLSVDGVGSSYAAPLDIIAVGEGGSGSLSATSGGTISSFSGVIGDAESAVGVATINGAGSKWTLTGPLTVGFEGNGTLHIQSGGVVSDTDADIAGQSIIPAGITPIGAVTVDGTGSMWTNSGTLTIGNVGNGTLDVTNGGTVSAGLIFIANEADSTGIATVDGIGSVLKTTSAGMAIGFGGDGTLNVRNGGLVMNSGNGQIGSQLGSIGTANVDGAGSKWTNGGNLAVAAAGDGTMNITNGGEVTNVDGVLGAGGSGNAVSGTATVDGVGSKWTNSGSLIIGQSALATGTLHIQNGGAVSDAIGYIGHDAGSSGAVTVTSVVASWTNSGALYIGYGGTGTLDIQSGAKVSDTDGSIGFSTDSSGRVTVDNVLSKWSNSGSVTVGDSGTGTLNITHGGAVSNVMQGTIGNEVGSTGTVTVDGNGSTWTNSASLFVSINGTGTLNIRNQGAVSDVNGAISQGSGSGTVNVDGHDSTWTNSGGLSVGVAGTATLNITNQGAVLVTMGSGMSVDGGTSVANVDGVGSKWMNGADLQVGIFGNATLNIINGGAVTNTDGFIASGTGSNGNATVDGVGSTWTNSGNVYVGGNSVGPAGTGLLRIENGGTVNASSTTVWNTGTLEIGVNPVLNGTLFFVGGTLRTIADTTFPNTILLGSGGIIVDSNGFNSTLSGPINGVVGGLTKINPGTIILTNTSTIPDGTNIYGGVLQVDGTLTSNTVVKTDGTLAGVGTISGNVENNGIVSPGDSPGTLTISGNYSQNSIGILRIEVAALAAGQHDLLSVGGSATLNGTLQVLQLNNFQPMDGDRVTIITDAGGHTGVFTTVTSTFLGLLQPVPQYDEANDVYIIFQLNSFNIGGLTPNQKSVAHNLDDAANDPAAADLVAFLQMEALGNLPRDYDLIAPEELAAMYEISISRAVVQNNNLQRRMDDIRAGSNGFCANNFVAHTSGKDFAGGKGADGKVVLDQKQGPDVYVPTEDNRWGVFINGTGDFVNVGDDDFNAPGYDITTGDFTLGADYRVSDHFAIGIDGGYASSRAELVNDGRVEVDGGKIGAYATVFGKGFFGSKVYLDGAIGGGLNNYDTLRIGLQDELVRGDTDGTELNGMIAYGSDWTFGCFNIGTWSSIQYTNVSIDEFTELGSLAPLEIQDQGEDSIRATTGIHASYDIKAGRAIIRPEVRAAYQHEYGDPAYQIDSRFASGAGGIFRVRGPNIGRDAALLGAGLNVQWNNRFSTYVYYDGVLGRNNYDNNAVTGGIRIGF